MCMVKHLGRVSKEPARAQTVTPERKLAFIEDVAEIMIPIVTNKNPQNPNGSNTTNTTNT